MSRGVAVEFGKIGKKTNNAALRAPQAAIF
jgi:hypothetical protein